MRGHIDVVIILMKYNINLNIQDDDGNTALHVAT
jgi:ankyrin repeat protein